MEIEHMKNYRATVKIRRGEGWDVKPITEQIEGTETVFNAAWLITEEEGFIKYVGEWAMMPERDGWPKGAPTWIASGDLENLREA